MNTTTPNKIEMVTLGSDDGEDTRVALEKIAKDLTEKVKPKFGNCQDCAWGDRQPTADPCRKCSQNPTHRDRWEADE